MGPFERIMYLLCCGCCITKSNRELLPHAIRQRRPLLDGSGTYVVYTIDIEE